MQQAARISLCVALAALVACSKTEPPPPTQKTAPKAASPASPAPVAAPGAPGTPSDIDEGLKERLARQEAAAKMFESKVLTPPAPAVPKPPAESRAPAPPPSAAPQVTPPAAPSKVDAPKAELAKAAPPKTEPPKTEPPRAEASKPAPVAAAPAPTPATRTEVAAAKPTTAVPEAPVTRLVSRVDPEFPREAASSGYETGNVKARMTLDAAGIVTRVEILSANPRRVFDRSVTRALSQWRYNEGAAGRTVDMEIDFRR